MNILILDDLQTRHTIAEKILGKDHTLFHAFDVYDAMDILEQCQQRIGLCLLNQSPDPEIDLIEYIGCHMQKDKYPAIAYVHSHNDNQSKDMVDDLRAMNIYAKHRPFSSKMISSVLQECTVQ